VRSVGLCSSEIIGHRRRSTSTRASTCGRTRRRVRERANVDRGARPRPIRRCRQLQRYAGAVWEQTWCAHRPTTIDLVLSSRPEGEKPDHTRFGKPYHMRKCWRSSSAHPPAARPGGRPPG
jgi:hypothetical protein